MSLLIVMRIPSVHLQYAAFCCMRSSVDDRDAPRTSLGTDSGLINRITGQVEWAVLQQVCIHNERQSGI